VTGSGEDAGDISEAIDITKSVQCSVEHSNLVLCEGSKSSLPGVWDPCLGEDKLLLIHYTNQVTRHQIFCPDNVAVLPKTAPD
jgi:DnaJ family protein C protein 11